MRSWRDRTTRVVDLGDATIVPGLGDAHAHLDREGLKYLYPSLGACRSIRDIQRLVARLARGRPPGEWIVTMPVGTPPFYGDAPGCLAEGRWPTRADLDAAAPDHPVSLRGIWGYWNRPPVHSVANSLALARAGVGRETRAPAGVEILRDERGEPTGVFVEHNAIQILELTLLRTVPPFTHADRLRALQDSLRRYAARGVTAVYEGHGVAPEVLRVYRETHERGALTLRTTVALSPTWEGVAEARRAIPELATWAGGRGLGDERLRVGGICLHYGGDREVARTLHAAQPLTGWAGFIESANTPEEYREQAALAARHGLRVNTLITRSLPEVLAIWEATAAEAARRHRWVLVHLNVATPDHLARIRRLGAGVTTNPISYLWRSGSEEVARAGGAATTLMPHRSLLRLGVPVALATDNKPADPWLAFRAVVARRDMVSGALLGPTERLTRRQALRALSVGGAWLAFAESERGVLAPGRLADLAVLDRNPLTIPLEDIPAMRCLATMVGGRFVHGDL